MIKDAPKISAELLINDIEETEIGTIYFYDQIVVLEARKDVVPSIKNGLLILLKVLKTVGTKSVVYISNRINDYSADPNDYRFLNLIPNLRGIVIVRYTSKGIASAQNENKFFRKPFYIVSNMEDAKQCATAILEGKSI